jgi:hypothetical protein
MGETGVNGDVILKWVPNIKCEQFVDSTKLALDMDQVRVIVVALVELWVL